MVKSENDIVYLQINVDLFHVEQNSPQIIHRAKNSEKFKQIHKFL